MLWLDTKYAKMLSYRLERWKIKKDDGQTFLAVCRCPLCGDSKKSKLKTRGNFYSGVDELHYKCFNCEASMYFGTFLKQFDSNLYSEYALEKFRRPEKEYNLPIVAKKEPKGNEPEFFIFDGVKTIEEMDDDHPAKQYVLGRKLPEYFLSKLYYVPKFFKWTEGHTDKFVGLPYPDHPRLIIPWHDVHGKCFAYHARAFGNEERRYFSVVLDRDTEKVYGLDRLDESKPIIVVEGQFDSMFLPNCVAVGSSALHMFTRPNCDVTYVYDVQPRNKEIVKLIGAAVKSGKKVSLIDPEDFPWKDINEAIQAGKTKDDILDIIQRNTVQGLRAEMKFSQWKKV